MAIKSLQDYINQKHREKYGLNHESHEHRRDRIAKNEHILNTRSLTGHDLERVQNDIKNDKAAIEREEKEIKSWRMEYAGLTDIERSSLAAGATIENIENSKAATKYGKFLDELPASTKSLIDSGAIDGAKLYEEHTGQEAIQSPTGLTQEQTDALNRAFGL